MDKEKYIKNYDLKLLNFKPKQTTNLHDQMKNYIRGCLYGNVIGNVMGLLTKKMNQGLIVCAEKYSNYIQNNDLKTKLLFSDAASATFVKYSKKKNVLESYFGFD